MKQNIGKYGGLTNRWATTRGHYVRLLTERDDGGALLLDILESVSKGVDLTEIQRVTGPEWRLRDALTPVQYSQKDWARVKQLQNRWSLNLGAK